METGYLILFFLFLCIVCFYFGFVQKRRPVWNRKGRSQVAFAVFMFIMFFCCYAAFQESKARFRLAKYLEPYPHAEIVWSPFIGSDTWMFETTDTPEAVGSFYSSPEHVKGWVAVQKNDALIEFRRGDMVMKIYILLVGNHTAIHYILEK